MNGEYQMKEKYFSSLLSTVKRCDLCERMCERKKVLSVRNGNLNAKVLFLAEAPGRLGAECTGIPLYGDKTGSNFELLLGNIGWRREDIFISNAVLCNPQDENGNNATPTPQEIYNCSVYLSMLLELIDPQVVVTLGIKALEAIKVIEDHNYVLHDNVAQPLKWNGRILFPLYHMGPRATIHRSLAAQRSDFIKLMHYVDPIKGIKKAEIQRAPQQRNISSHKKLEDMVYLIVANIGKISFFKTTKILYLCDLEYQIKYGKTISGAVYLRMQEGPWIPYLRDVVHAMDKKTLFLDYVNNKPMLAPCPEITYTIDLEKEELEAVQRACEKYKNYSDKLIKIAAYRSAPMSYILKEEKKGRNMTKVPVLYNDHTVMDVDNSHT